LFHAASRFKSSYSAQFHRRLQAVPRGSKHFSRRKRLPFLTFLC
jgi:hypothetical protein